MIKTASFSAKYQQILLRNNQKDVYKQNNIILKANLSQKTQVHLMISFAVKVINLDSVLFGKVIHQA